MKNKIELGAFLVYHQNGRKAFSLEELAKKATTQEEIDEIQERVKVHFELHNNQQSKIFSVGLDAVTFSSYFLTMLEVSHLNLLQNAASHNAAINSQDPIQAYLLLAATVMANIGLTRIDYLINHDYILTNNYLIKKQEKEKSENKYSSRSSTRAIQ